MKTNLIGLFLILIITSCVTRPKVTADANKAKVTERKNVNPYKLILGKWKMESNQVYSPGSEPTNSEGITWEFKDDHEMFVSQIQGKQATMNTHKYWMNKSIVNINGQLYMYYFEEPLGLYRMGNVKPFGDELWLDSNLDPSISDHGPKIHFTRIP